VNVHAAFFPSFPLSLRLGRVGAHVNLFGWVD